jgi:hypothetical protein
MADIFNIILLIIKIISALVSLVLGAIFLYYAEKSGYWDDLRKYASYRKLPEKEALETTDRLTTDWRDVKARLETGDEASIKLAVIEADKLVDNLLKKMGYVGNSMGDRLKLLEKSSFQSLDDLWKAHKIRNRIVHHAEYSITPEESRKAIEIYEKVLRELKAL